MEAFLVSTGVVALAEIGDKTQLLALVLAARFRKPVPIILGILVATLANHALAGAAGAWISAVIGPAAMRWVLGLSFIAMALWTLIPDKYEEAKDTAPRFGVFGTTLIAFSLLEMGDKTQIATVALTRRGMVRHCAVRSADGESAACRGPYARCGHPLQLPMERAADAGGAPPLRRTRRR